MAKPPMKDKVSCVKGMKDYECALGDDCSYIADGIGHNTIEKGEEHLVHAQQGAEGIFSERYHKECWPEHENLKRGEYVRI